MKQKQFKKNYVHKVQIEPCPKCKSTNVARIIYGLLCPGPAMLEEFNKGTIIRGGCVIKRDSPKYHCNNCGCDWGKHMDYMDYIYKKRLDEMEIIRDFKKIKV